MSTPYEATGRFSVEPTDSVNDWLVQKHLDWKVQRRKLFMRESPSDEYPSVELPNYAITRSSDGRVFQISSDGYVPRQNSEMIQEFRDWASEAGFPIVSVGSAKEGAIVWAAAKTQDSITLRGNDKMDGYIILSNSHDGSTAFKASSFLWRQICSNGMMGWKRQSLFFKKHTKQLLDKPALRQAIQKALASHSQNMDAFRDTSEKLSQAHVQSQQTVREYILRLTRPNLLSEIIEKTKAIRSTSDRMIEDSPLRITDKDLGKVGRSILWAIAESPGSELPSAKNTWWGVVNGVTHYVDHHSSKNPDARIASGLFGSGSALKQSAVELAVEYSTRPSGTMN